MAEKLELALGEEKAVHLPPLTGADWRYEVEGMSSAVDVRKLWAANPYPEDNEEEEEAPELPDVVFMIRGVAPGSATVRFSAGGGETQGRTVQVAVTERGAS